MRPDCDNSCIPAAAVLNRNCACLTVDRRRLQVELEKVLLPGMLAERPNLFAESLVFVAQAHLQQMAELAAAVDHLVRLPAYRDAVLAWAPAIARQAAAQNRPLADGVFLGYDFHLHGDGPQLIEINTNAGGGLLNTCLLRAQSACCDTVALPAAEAIEADFIAMFRAEWAIERGDAPLTRIAIVDNDPVSQFLAPEFELFRRLFLAHGIDAVIADPQALQRQGGQLVHAGQPVDLVYNRLTDFALDEPQHAVLRQAWLDQAVVLTPHPLAHALYADKRNLILLSDPAALAGLGVPAAVQQILARTIPRTVAVTAEQGERFWGERKQWFFKPASGFGSRAAYRGDKLTKRVFEEILAGDYVAQALVPPSQRRLHVGDEAQDLKLDLRNYVYRDRVQLAAARLYQGQTTNFRTPGGGFATVATVPCLGSSCAAG